MIRKQPALFVLVWAVLGIVLADQLRLPSWLPLLVSAFLVVAGLYAVYRTRPTAGTILLGAGLGFLVGFHFSLNHVDIGPRHIAIAAQQSRLYRIYGRVADWPDLRQNRTEIKLAVDSIRGDITRPVAGAVILKIGDTTTALQRGDRIEFAGRIYPLPSGSAAGSFDYGRYLNLKGVQGIVYLNSLLNVRVDRRPRVGWLSLVDDLRAAVSSSFRRNLTPTASALAGGFLIGETRDIPVEVYEMFRDSGTLHLLAVSGSNVALVLAFFLALLRPFQLRPFGRSLILLAVIVLFAGLSYGEPSVVRASLMASLVIGARLLRRTHDLNNIIALTALIILAVEPSQLFDVGFQLSFITAWGLILLVPRVCAPLKPYHGRWWYRGIIFPLIVAVVAQVCSTPVVAYYFGRIPVISIFANLVIVVMVSIGVVAILAMLVIDLIWPLLGLMAGSLVNIWLNLIVSSLVWMGGDEIPVIQTGPLLDGAAGVWLVILVYVLIVLAGFAISCKPARRAILILTLLVGNLILLGAAFAGSENDRLEVTFTTVPGGLAATVTDPSTQQTDLIITGIRHKPYPIDERIIWPWLQRKGVEEVRRVFLLAADYDAIDDVLRLTSRTNCRSLQITDRLRPSVRDHVRSLEKRADSLTIQYFRTAGDSGGDTGYSWQDGGLHLQTPGASLLFVDRLQSANLTPLDTVRAAFLAVGQKWTGSANDWVELHSRGYRGVICSKFEQASETAYYDPALEPDNLPPHRCHDLSVEGEFVLSLPIAAE